MKAIPRVSLLGLLSFAIASCHQIENSTTKQPSVQTIVPQKPIAAPARSPKSPPAETRVDYESDPLCQEAIGLFHSDIHKAIELLESAIAKAPDSPNSAPYYLLLGRIKKEFEKCFRSDYAASSLTDPEKQCEGFTEYAKAHPTEYFYNEVGGNYLYGGFHFQELEKRFPTSPLAVEAAYEFTKLSQGGECEGFVDCYIENGFTPVHNFLLRYPDSPHTAEAAKRADDAFRQNLWGDIWKTERGEIKDANKASDDYYDPAVLKKMVQEYEDLAEKLPLRYRARAWETVAYYRALFGEKDHARDLYERILQQVPDYESNAEIRKKLAARQ